MDNESYYLLNQGLSDNRVNLDLYITDQKGIVIYDSQGIATGQDYSKWNDVYLTLRGKYGVRSTRSYEEDSNSSTMFIAAPIYYQIDQQQKLIGVVSIGKPFDAMVLHLEQAIKDNNMALVAQASASRAAASRGVKIPGNMVLMVFRNDYAVRMLEASVAAGIEAPLRIYVTEQADGSTRLSYPLPSAVFRPYGDARIDAMAQELDPIFERIVRDATASGDVQRH